MSKVALNKKTPSICQAFLSNNLIDLARIYEPNINICMVERQVDVSVSRFIGYLLKRQTMVSVIKNISCAGFDFFSVLPEAAQLPGYQDFCKDVARLVSLYSDLFALNRVGLRLCTLEHAMCPKFHFDSVTCRLLCTYGGTGTQWLEDAYLDRGKLGTGSGGLKDEESGLILDRDAIQTMPAYAIGLLKGCFWKGNEQHGAVHRSPQITSPRVLLTLDFG
ncbi:MAG: DUF1826 domain-containing protein [Methylococcaceae bacterium]|jgi:hypothetical protein